MYRIENPHILSSFMRLLTRTIAPVGRVRGLGFAAEIPRRLWGDRITRARLNDDTVFCFPTFDSYWSYYVHLNRPYEPALHVFFSKLSQYNFTFVDCGANCGFWSALLSSHSFGSHRCLAIEASPSTFQILLETARCNDNRFECLNRAISSKSDVTVLFDEGDRHAGRHIIDGINERRPVNKKSRLLTSNATIEVATVTLSDIARDIPGDLVIKLDIEGVEIDAIEGAGDILSRSLFIYEDFGADLSHEITAAVLERGFQVAYPAADGSLKAINELADLKSIKTKRHTGMDFLAWCDNNRLMSELGSGSK